MKIVNISIEKLVPFELNNKDHSDFQVEKLAEIIKLVGFKKPLAVFTMPDGRFGIITGHGARLAGIKLGMVELPCIVHDDLSPQVRDAWRLADNKVAELSTWNLDNVSAEVARLVELEFDVDIIGFDEQEIETLLKDQPGLIAKIFEEEEQPKTVKVGSYDRKAGEAKEPSTPVTIAGDGWTLGGLTLNCDEPESAANCDWIISRWESKTGESAIHHSGKTFKTIKDGRKK